MTFDTLVKRALMESREDSDIRTLDSGAEFWGGMAVAPNDPFEITLEQSKDYGIPPSNYKKIGEGSASLAYSDGNTIVKIGKARRGGTFVNGAIQETQWTDILRGRMREHEKLKEIESIPPYLKLQEGTWIPYYNYKNLGMKRREGDEYHEEVDKKGHRYNKGYGIFDRYKFSTAGSRILDNGIIEQQVVDTKRYKIPDNKRNLLYSIREHIEDHVGSVDNRGMSGNIFFDPDNRIIYVIDN